MPAPLRTSIEVEGRTLSLSNLEKVYYPETGFTKGAMIDYYARAANALLTHLAGKVLTFKRYPEGVEGEHFYEKRCPSHRPPWMRTVRVESDHHGHLDMCVVEDLAGLVWAANLGTLELHVSLHDADDPEHPRAMIFDLDPGPPAGLLECTRVALRLEELLGRLGLASFVKTSGKKGLHVYVPVREATYDDTRALSRSIATILARRHPDEAVSVMRKDVRAGKVYVDWAQNHRAKTTVCAYSLRATLEPRVSAPVTWAEVRAAARSGRTAALEQGPDEVLARLARRGDAFEGAAALVQRLPAEARAR